MPTGYTTPVQQGEITDFRTFALSCSRAFGAAIMMRDDPITMLPTVERLKENSSLEYHRKKITEAQADLLKLTAMTPEEIAAAAKAENDRARTSYERNALEIAAYYARYTTMLEKAKAWEPPSAEHENLKEFMIEQITSSIKFDVYEPTCPAERTPESWFAEELKSVTHSVT